VARYHGKVLSVEAESWLNGELPCADYYAGIYALRRIEAEQDVAAKLAQLLADRQQVPEVTLESPS
jgi:hypothetical protein